MNFLNYLETCIPPCIICLIQKNLITEFVRLRELEEFKGLKYQNFCKAMVAIFLNTDFFFSLNKANTTFEKSGTFPSRRKNPE